MKFVCLSFIFTLLTAANHVSTANAHNIRSGHVDARGTDDEVARAQEDLEGAQARLERSEEEYDAAVARLNDIQARVEGRSVSAIM